LFFYVEINVSNKQLTVYKNPAISYLLTNGDGKRTKRWK